MHDPEAHVDVSRLARSSQEARMFVRRGLGTLAALALVVTFGAACSDDDGQKPGVDSGADTGALEAGADAGTDVKPKSDGQAADSGSDAVTSLRPRL